MFPKFALFFSSIRNTRALCAFLYDGQRVKKACLKVLILKILLAVAKKNVVLLREKMNMVYLKWSFNVQSCMGLSAGLCANLRNCVSTPSRAESALPLLGAHSSARNVPCLCFVA